MLSTDGVRRRPVSSLWRDAGRRALGGKPRSGNCDRRAGDGRTRAAKGGASVRRPQAVQRRSAVPHRSDLAWLRRRAANRRSGRGATYGGESSRCLRIRRDRRQLNSDFDKPSSGCRYRRNSSAHVFHTCMGNQLGWRYNRLAHPTAVTRCPSVEVGCMDRFCVTRIEKRRCGPMMLLTRGQKVILTCGE